MIGNSHLIFNEFQEGKDNGLCFALPVFTNGLISVGTLSVCIWEKYQWSKKQRNLK